MNAPASAPWTITGDEVVAALDSDIVRGLDDAQASGRLERDGPNELVEAPPVPFSERVVAQFKDPLVALLLAAIVISLIAWIAEGAEGFPIEPVVIATIVILNAALGLWQEMRTEQAVAALKDMTSPHALVIRNGRVVEILSSELVVGDVLALEEGDAVSADCRMVDSAGLDVAEAPLTGESQPVTKTTDPLASDTALADRTNMVYSGTAVTRGRGRAVVVATGMRTEIGKIAELLGAADSGETPLQRQISWLGKMLGILVVCLSVVVVGSVLLTSDDRSFTGVIDALVVGVSLAVAAVPEGLLAIMSIVLALGVQRMAEHGAIVKRLSSVETLGSASVICTDKTGTLTRNEMTVVAAVVGDVEIEITGVGYRPIGDAVLNGERLQSGPIAAELRYLLAAGALASDAAIESDGNDQWDVRGDPTEIAFLVAEHKVADVAAREARFDRLDVVPFTSERKMMTTLQRDGDDERMLMISKGAPDVLLDRCTRERRDGDDLPLDDERRAALLATVDGLADRALRTLAVAYREVERGATTIGPDHEEDMVWLGVVGIVDPPRDEVADSIREAHDAGIQVVMITGDHPRTAQRIADQLDVDAVHARVEPDDKLRIVEELQADGNVVSMTGDGVNDAPALRTADIGVAMGITGTEVSKEAADVILTDDNFSTILRAVREGREIFADLQKVIRYLLASNTGEVLVMLFGVLGAGLIGLDAVEGELAVPLLATQILWINLLTDSALAMALGVDPAVDEVMSRPPRGIEDRVIDKPMMVTIGLIGLVSSFVALLAFDLEMPGGFIEGDGDITTARTMVFTTLVIAQVGNAFNSRSDVVSAFVRPFENRLLWLAVAVTVLLQVAVVHLPFLNDAFDTVPLDAERWAVCCALAAVVLAAGEIRKVFTRATMRRQPALS
ncbi:MAG: cation-translocating P-type ATPase [Ilumatobacter fluminis]|uniref:cation-translocating P-type ATPase n=1 Tax=Ilumatobacter fluminis TaxID=467091 RepID=UPI0032EC4CFA